MRGPTAATGAPQHPEVHRPRGGHTHRKRCGSAWIHREAPQGPQLLPGDARRLEPTARERESPLSLASRKLSGAFPPLLPAALSVPSWPPLARPVGAELPHQEGPDRDHVLVGSWRRRPRDSRYGENRGLPGNWGHTGSWGGGAEGIRDRHHGSFPFNPCFNPQAAVESGAQGKNSVDPLSGFLAWCGQAGVELNPKVRHGGPARAGLRSALVSSLRP